MSNSDKPTSRGFSEADQRLVDVCLSTIGSTLYFYDTDAELEYTPQAAFSEVVKSIVGNRPTNKPIKFTRSELWAATVRWCNGFIERQENEKLNKSWVE